MEQQNNQQPLALWTPLWTIVWSLFLSPAFGSFLQTRNWKALGNTAKAKSSGRFFWITVALMVLYIIVIPFLPDSDFMDKLWTAVWTAYWAGWAVYSWAQVKEVKQLPKDQPYQRKSWTKPVLITVALLLLALVVGLFWTLGLDIAGVISLEG